MITIHRALHDKEHPYVMIARGVAQNKAISYEALGLLTYLLSKPDDWKIVPEDLGRAACGKNRVYKLLKELKEAGYITQERSEAAHDKPPMWGERIVCEEPNTALREMAREPSSHNPATPYMANAVYGENALTKQEKKNTDQRQELNTQTARAPVRKDFEDVPKQDRLEIIRAWAENLSIQPVSVYSRDAYHRHAAEIFRAGYRGHQVSLFVKAKMQDPFWDGKNLSLEKVGELMPLWLLHTYDNKQTANGNGNGKHASPPPSPTSPKVPSTSAGAPAFSLSKGANHDS